METTIQSANLPLVEGQQVLSLPRGAKILEITPHVVGGRIYITYLADSHAQEELRQLRVAVPGSYVSPALERFLGSVLDPRTDYRYFIFEKVAEVRSEGPSVTIVREEKPVAT